MKSSKFQVYNSPVRHIYYNVCSPLIVRFHSVTTYLTSFTPSTSPFPTYPLLTTILLSVSMSLCLYVLFVGCFQVYISHLSGREWWHKPRNQNISQGPLSPSLLILRSSPNPSSYLCVCFSQSFVPQHCPYSVFFLQCFYHTPLLTSLLSTMPTGKHCSPTSLGSLVISDVEMCSVFISSQTLLQGVNMWSPR